MLYSSAGTLASAGSNDAKHLPRIVSALVVTDSRTGKTNTIDQAEEALLFRALGKLRNEGYTNAAHPRQLLSMLAHSESLCTKTQPL